ncbi:hypothetical protein RUM43_014718 [Polyplax serrata]|uniref:Uncharacterized protein n=1 Tax=Polyplax serrata TaxID=468196 RepID=A0AAN8NIQ7_POLSC
MEAEGRGKKAIHPSRTGVKERKLLTGLTLGSISQKRMEEIEEGVRELRETDDELKTVVWRRQKWYKKGPVNVWQKTTHIFTPSMASPWPSAASLDSFTHMECLTPGLIGFEYIQGRIRVCRFPSDLVWVAERERERERWWDPGEICQWNNLIGDRWTAKSFLRPR